MNKVIYKVSIVFYKTIKFRFKWMPVVSSGPNLLHDSIHSQMYIEFFHLFALNWLWERYWNSHSFNVCLCYCILGSFDSRLLSSGPLLLLGRGEFSVLNQKRDEGTFLVLLWRITNITFLHLKRVLYTAIAQCMGVVSWLVH